MSESREESERLELLVRRARRGDERAFDALVRAVRPRIRRWALVRVESTADAEDVAQAVLLKLEGRLGDFEGRSRFSSWLYRLTMNAATDHLRSRSARERMREDATRRHDRISASPVTKRVAEERLIELVRAFFEELPDRQRQVFDLVDLQGRSPAEVAEMLELNPNTLRANLFKARRTIRTKILEGHPALAEDWAPTDPGER